MIIGLIVKNYKCYKGINFISFIKDKPEHLRLVIGKNGVGKSAILEAMDTYFNGATWTIHSEAAKNDSFVSVVYLMEKSKANSIVGNENNEILSKISDTLWNLSESQNSNYGKFYSAFFKLKDNVLSTYKDTHYLLLAGYEIDRRETTFITFKNSIEEGLKILHKRPTSNTISHIFNNIREHYSYLYIPVESSVSDFLKLEARGMQVLMDKTIKDTITDTFNEKRIRRNIAKRQIRSSFLDMINENLEEYINAIEKHIQKINKDYNFERDSRQRTKLTSNHITDVIIEAYYSKRKLKKGNKPISTLSSGEKRRALIDIIYAFIKHSNNIEKELILAIDEPESSLHISNCYEQFEIIQQIALQYQKNVFVATHWYGSLPILRTGILMHIDDNQKCSIFNLSNYFEARGEHPDDIQFKSFFDLSSSILSSLRNTDVNWLLVEGADDKRYLEYYLDTDRLKIKILPLCGCGNVKKIYEYLFVPISSKKLEELNGKKQKVYCLIDTDLVCTQIHVESKTTNGILKIGRLQETLDHTISLLPIENPNRAPTEIEEALHPEMFYNALKNTIEKNGTDVEKESFEAFDFDTVITNSKILGDYSILSHKGNGRALREDKEVIKAFIDNNKTFIAEEYVKLEKIGNTPAWITEIESFFTN